MNTMDLKGIAWVGNICQKFEAMCLEVEETMCQDTVKYVENQVQTVGASVKRFYSDVMQDLLPPSSIDPLKVAAADLSVKPYADVAIHKKPKASIKEDTRVVDKLSTEDFKVIAGPVCLSSSNGLRDLNHVPPPYSQGSVKGPYTEFCSGKNKDGEICERSNVRIKGISRKYNCLPSEKSSSNNPTTEDQSMASLVCEISENHDAAHDQIAMMSPRTSVEVLGFDSNEEEVEGEEREIHNNIRDVNVSINDASIDSRTSDTILSVESSGKKGRKLRCISSIGGLSAESSDTCTNSGLVSQIGSYISSDTQSSQSAGSGRSGNFTDVIEDNGTTEPSMKTIEQDGKSKLEETCVLVDGNKLCFVSHREGKHRSYKKKIWEAFSLKLRSARKQEYERLAAKYGDTHTGPDLNSVESVLPSLTRESNTEKLQTCDFSESEWELL